MSQRIGHQRVNYVELYVHFQRHIFKSDECHRELDINVSIVWNCVNDLGDTFSKVTSVIEV